MKNDDFTIEEIQLIKQLGSAGLPDDFADVVCNEVAGVNRKTKKAIQKATLKKIHTSKITGRFMQWPGVAVLLAALIFTAALGPQRILAEISGMIRFVPGFGLENAEQITLAAVEPVIITRGDTVYEISGMLVNSQYTTMHIKAEGAIRGVQTFTGEDEEGNKLPYLLDEEGSMYVSKGHSISYGNSYHGVARGSFTLDAVNPGIRLIYLVLPDISGGTWQMPIPLITADNLIAAEELYLTAHRHGVTVTAMHQSRDEESVVTLLIQPIGKNSYVTEVGNRYHSQSTGRPPTLRDNEGREFSLLDKGSSTGYVGGVPYELHFSRPESTADFLYLSIPEIHFQIFSVNTNFTLPVPLEGEMKLDKKIRLDRFTATVTSVERISPTELRIYVDPGPDAEQYLESFRLSTTSSMMKVNEHTGRMEYFEVDITPGQKTIKLTADRPEYVVVGPWEIEIPLRP